MSDPNRYYDRQGREITVEEYRELRMRGLDYKRVAFNTIDRTRHHPRGRAYIEVSTVWDGMDCFHDVGETPHSRLFETLVTTWRPPNGTSPSEDRYWWATEQEAIEGHERVVCELTATGDNGAVTSGGES